VKGKNSNGTLNEARVYGKRKTVLGGVSQKSRKYLVIVASHLRKCIRENKTSVITG